MKRFLFEYTVISTGEKGGFSLPAETEDIARSQIRERVADLEFLEPEEIEVGKLIKEVELTDTYYECEGCT